MDRGYVQPIYEYDENYNEYRVHPLLDMSESPAINVMSASLFQERVSEIFQMTADVLAKSYGPYGSSSIISEYPYHNVTKDGFSIMKKLSFSKDFTIVDDAIKGLIETPCSRLNYAVGDGTTTAIIAVNAIYQAYLDHKDEIKKENIPPRDILTAYNKIRDEIVEALKAETEYVDTTNHDEMVDTMTKIAYISANGDEEITNLIHDLYDKLDYPLIEIKKAPDGKTKYTVSEGYHFNAILKDSIYVNNDDFTGEYHNVDILIFDHKITMDCFKSIILPLNEECRKLRRHLVIIAPTYDDVAMLNISRTLNGEFKATNDVNLILMVGSMVNGINRALCEDLAVVLNTTIINMGLEKDFMNEINNGVSVTSLIDINNRNIPGLVVSVRDGDRIGWSNDTGSITDEHRAVELTKDAIRAGYAENVILGMNDGSTFDGLYYNEFLYDKTINNIRHKLTEAQKRSESVNTYNFEAKDLQKRLFNLQMKIGTIEVGGESTLSQELMYDVVDDTVKATSSAYHNGIVKGCSVSTLRAIDRVRLKGNHTDLENIIINCIRDGFRSVYKVLLSSVFDDTSIRDIFDFSGETTPEKVKEIYIKIKEITKWNINYNDFKNFVFASSDRQNVDREDDPTTMLIRTTGDNLFDTIIDFSVYTACPFDLSTREYNPSIINSAKTDTEVLLASSDLISLLITGNQFIIADH